MNPGTGIFNVMRLNRHRFYGTKFHVRAEVMDALKKDTEETSALDGVPKDKYSISYILDNKNLKDQTQFTMTFQGPKILFDQLKIDKLKNIN